MKPKKYEFEGSFYTLLELADMHKTSVTSIRNRLKKGMSIEEAVKKPQRVKRLTAYDWEDPKLKDT